MAGVSSKTGIVGLLKRGWNEIPDVIGGSVVGIVGIALGFAGLANYYRKDGDNRRYKMGYVIMRPDDPRSSKVHKD